MSADNWTECPKCRVKVKAEKLAAHEKAAKVYGKVPAEEWKAMLAKADAMPDEPEQTLREDYEIGIYRHVDGSEPKFYASYAGRCTECDFEHLFKVEQGLKLKGGAK